MRLTVFVEWFVPCLLNRLKLRPNTLRLNSCTVTLTVIDVRAHGSVLLNKVIETFANGYGMRRYMCVINFVQQRLLGACVQDFLIFALCNIGLDWIFEQPKQVKKKVR